MSYTSCGLRRASGVNATGCRALAALVADNLGSAGGAEFGHFKFYLAAVTRRGYGTDYLGDNFSCLADHDGVAYTDVKLGDKLCVVEGGSGDGGACEPYGGEVRRGGKDSRSAHLDIYG